MNDKEKLKIKNIVYELRKVKAVTQEQLALELNITRQTVIAMEKGNYIPTLLLAIKISRYFKLPLEKIFIYEN